MRVFLTGGTGFVGSHVARALASRGHEVRALRRRRRVGPSGIDAGAGASGESRERIEWVEGDLLEPPSLAAGMKGCAAVIHCGAEIVRMGSPAALAHQRRVNVEGTRNVLEAARHSEVTRVVHTSSVAALGRPAHGRVADEDTPYDWPPGLPYNETKRDAEQAALAAVELGQPVVVLSPALVLGPGDPRRRWRGLLRAVERGLARVAPPGGITLCDVRDVAEAHVAALDRGRSGQRYILGGARVRWRELLDLLASALGAPAPILTLPAVALRLGALPLQWLAPRQLGGSALALLTERFYSSERAIAELGYREAPAEQLIADTVADY